MVPVMFWSIVRIAATMTSLLMKVKEFLSLLKKECDAQFSNGLPKITVATTNPTNKSLKNLKINKEDRDLFQLFHNNAASPEFKTPACQCGAVEGAFNHVRENKIPFDEVEITCEGCGQVFKLPVPKNAHSEEMGNINIAQQLINGNLDYL